jgi:hypothetical protein
LTLEQEFGLVSFTNQMQQMSREQAQSLLIEQCRYMIYREAGDRTMLKHKWKLDVNFTSTQDRL